MDAEQHATYLREAARKLTPAGARLVVELIDAGKVKYPEDVILALLQRAGEMEEPKRTEKPIGTVGAQSEIPEDITW